MAHRKFAVDQQKCPKKKNDYKQKQWLNNCDGIFVCMFGYGMSFELSMHSNGNVKAS